MLEGSKNLTHDNNVERELIKICSLYKNMLQDCAGAFNEMPRTKLNGKYKDTYSLVSKVEKLLKN